MPIPMPPPPPPYVAPDLRPIVARPSARLVFVRDRQSGRVVDRALEHGVWLAAEGAPLELRFHRRADGSVWGEQATYVNGERGLGFARVSASAHVQGLSKRVVGGLGVTANFVSYSIAGRDGATLRTWSAPLCGSMGPVRLDREGSPDDPTFPASWQGCETDYDPAYVLGRITGLDRGWAMQLPTKVAALAPLPAGRYELRIDLDPLDALADTDRSNDTTTLPLTVRVITRSASSDEGDGEGDGERIPFPAMPSGTAVTTSPAGGPTRSSANHTHRAGAERSPNAPVAPEPEWYTSRLHIVEAAVARQRALREAGPALRAREPMPAAPADVDLPDLKAAPSYGIRTDTVTRGGVRRDLLRFGALTWNAGPGPLEVEAFRERGTTLAAYQVFSRDGERSTRQARGTLVWHAAPGHDHFHFAAFAAYSLTRLDGAMVRDGGKHSWCIVDTDEVDTTLPGVLDPAGRESGGCGSDSGSLWARLRLSVGSGDYYGPGLAGQSFDISSVENGSYRIKVEANPTGVIAEADLANNVATRIVTLGGVPGARTVVERPVPTVNDDAIGDCDEC